MTPREALERLVDDFGALRSTASEQAQIHRLSPDAGWYAGSIYAWDEAIRRIEQARAALAAAPEADGQGDEPETEMVAGGIDVYGSVGDE